MSEVSRGEDFSATVPRELFQTAFVDTMAHSWSIAPDGRFLLIKPSAEEANPLEIRVVLNWHQELLERVPVP